MVWFDDSTDFFSFPDPSQEGTTGTSAVKLEQSLTVHAEKKEKKKSTGEKHKAGYHLATMASEGFFVK